MERGRGRGEEMCKNWEDGRSGWERDGEGGEAGCTDERNAKEMIFVYFFLTVVVGP